MKELKNAEDALRHALKDTGPGSDRRLREVVTEAVTIMQLVREIAANNVEVAICEGALAVLDRIEDAQV
jgi:hypothetical protein